MENVKIKIIIKNKNNLLANANLSINTVDFGYLTIKGFQLWKSKYFNQRLQEDINITPPMSRVYMNFLTIVFFEDVNKWHILENLIYKQFCEERKNEEQKVNLDEIPEL